MVAFSGAAVRALAAPAQLPEHAPDLRDRVANLTGFPNHLRDALERPQGGANPPGRRALEQRGFQPPQVLGTQTRPAAGPSRAAQPRASLPPPGVIPPVHAGTADAQTPRDFRLPMAPLEQLGGLHPASLEGRKVPPRPQSSLPARSLPQPGRIVLLYYENIIRKGGRSPSHDGMSSRPFFLD